MATFIIFYFSFMIHICSFSIGPNYKIKEPNLLLSTQKGVEKRSCCVYLYYSCRLGSRFWFQLTKAKKLFGTKLLNP
jgi:hypothetical protein